MRVIFISGKIRARTQYGIAENVRKAHEASLKLFKEGWSVICPHKNTENMCGALGRNGHTDFRRWMEIDFALLQRLKPEEGDAVYMLKDWRKSEGSRMERQEAKRLGLQILYEDENGH